MQANIRLKCPILTDVWVTSIFWSKVARKQKVSHGISRKQDSSRISRRIARAIIIPQVQDSKVQMEELQWGFPIATTLS